MPEYHRMLAVTGQSLLALVLATTILASPASLTDHVLPHNIEIRQDNSVKCDTTYTTLNGLNLTTYCGQFIVGNDVGARPVHTDSYEDCMEHCSRYWGVGEGCFGVTWVYNNGDCWIKNSSVSTTALEPNLGRYSALVERSQMEGVNETCPHADLSINTLPGVDGMQYTTNCGKMIKEGGACFKGYPCLEGLYEWFYHTETLEECMEICIDQQPLCRAVSWNPTMEIGYANCIPKTGFESGYTDSLDVGAGPILFHSASMTQIDQIDIKCPERESYTVDAGSANAKGFEVHCGRLNPGTNITSLHTQNVTACMDACATGNIGCKAILFDSTLMGGFKNCYLQNTTSVISDQPGATYAVLLDVDIPSSSPSSSLSSPGSSDNAPSTSSPSKAWIAGPVAGGVVALALIGFAIFWWRRRKAAKAAGEEKNVHNGDALGYASVPAYSANAEFDGAGTSELPASTKYAHNYGPKSEAQELPS